MMSLTHFKTLFGIISIIQKFTPHVSFHSLHITWRNTYEAVQEAVPFIVTYINDRAFIKKTHGRTFFLKNQSMDWSISKDAKVCESQSARYAHTVAVVRLPFSKKKTTIHFKPGMLVNHMIFSNIS